MYAMATLFQMGLFMLFWATVLAVTSEIPETVKAYERRTFEECSYNGPLGMITGDIQDWQITASSTYPQEWDEGCHERYGRVYQPNGLGWCAKYKSSSEWLQVDLGVAAKITGVMTQGRGDGAEWVTSFMVSFSMDAFHWQYVSDQYGNQRVFEGNVDSYAVKHSYLDEPIVARFIKFHTVHWNKHPSMRVEIIGCQVCKSLLALPPYGKITASSAKPYKQGSSCLADDGFIMTNKGWCAKDNNANQWLQFDVGPPTMVTGVMTKGRGDTGRKHWVTRFRLSYSNDSRVWYYYKDATHLDPKNHLFWLVNPPVDYSAGRRYIADRMGPDGLEFGGNVDKEVERYHYLNSPFVARFIRFHPIDWHNKISMRAGLIGCPHLAKADCGKGFMRVNEDTPCVENMAYQKESWINNKRHFKRHVRNQWMHGHAARAVDGSQDQSLHSCTILDNFYVEKPIWMVDLGTKTKISGIVIVTWQGQGDEPVAAPQISASEPEPETSTELAEPQTSYRDYMYNLDKLVVYVDSKGGKSQVDLPTNMCGFISRLNDALFRPKLHVQCLKPVEGRYVYIEAWGVPNRWSRLFSAVLCEVMVYS